MKKLFWPELTFPPINLWNVWKRRDENMISYGGFTRETIEEHSTPVPEAGCWLWDGGLDKDGYPNYIRDNLIRKRPSRVSYEVFNGDIPEGQIVRHTCDNPSCVNPTHLVVGTWQDNMNDKMERGRWRGGRPKRV